MCLRDLLNKLRHAEVEVTEAQVRWAVTSRKISRPALDGSLRFIFEEQHFQSLCQLFGRADEAVR